MVNSDCSQQVAVRVHGLRAITVLTHCRIVDGEARLLHHHTIGHQRRRKPEKQMMQIMRI